MDIISTNAFGKAMICGEYAVLDLGNPALAIGFDIGITVEIKKADSYSYCIPQFWHEPIYSIRVLKEKSPAVAYAILFWQERIEQKYPLCKFHLTVKRQVINSGDPKGLGTSSAVVVAVMKALNLLQPDVSLTADKLIYTAIKAHQASQGGQGSGYDIATAYYGGLLQYTRSSHGPYFLIDRLPVPEGIYIGWIKPGLGSKSSDLIRKFYDLDEKQKNTIQSEIATASIKVIHAFQAEDDVDRIINEISSAEDVFQRHAKSMGLITNDMQRLIAQAPADITLRTSGAGGGDGMLAFSRNCKALQAYFDNAKDEGYVVYPIIMP